MGCFILFLIKREIRITGLAKGAAPFIDWRAEKLCFSHLHFSDFNLITITASLGLSEVGQSGSCRVVAMTAGTQGETLSLQLRTDHEQRDELSYRLCDLERLRETTVAQKQICCRGFQLQQG